MLSNRRVPALTSLAILLVAITLASAWRPLVRPFMYAWTGEEDAWQQIKGTVAYLGLLLTRRTPDLAPYTPIKNIPDCPFGVNTFLEQEAEPAKVARSLNLIRDAGFCFVRQEFPWEDIEISAKGDYWDHKWGVSAWAKYDRIVDLASQRGLQIIARLDNPPAWARTGDRGESLQGPPDRVQDFGDFVEAVVRRYKGKVRYYQIWNEPNLYHEWGDQPVDAAAYTRLLQEAYRRAKAVDPDCVIISAGLAPTLEQGPKNVSDLTYLQRMYDAGARGSFDILGVMAYGLWTGPTDHRVDPQRTNFARPQLIRAMMVRNGDAATPIWAMEIGWNALPKDFQGPAVFGRVDRQQQARYAAQAYERARREWPWMGVMNYWFFRRATDSEKSQPLYYFGLLEPDFTPWPAYQALKDYATRPAPLYPGYHPPDRVALQYSGSWQPHDDPQTPYGQYRQGSKGAHLRFTFWGSELDLVTLGGNPAAVRVTVDGQPGRPAAATAGRETLLTLVRRSSPGTHTVDVEVTGDGLAVAGVIVRRTERWGWYALAGVAATLATLAGYLAVRRMVMGPGRPGRA